MLLLAVGVTKEHVAYACSFGQWAPLNGAFAGSLWCRGAPRSAPQSVHMHAGPDVTTSVWPGRRGLQWQRDLAVGVLRQKVVYHGPPGARHSCMCQSVRQCKCGSHACMPCVQLPIGSYSGAPNS